MRFHTPFRHTPHTFRGSIGSSTESPNGCVGMRFHPPFWHTPRAFRGPIGGPTKGPSDTARLRPPPPSTALVPCASPTQNSAS
eukprot:6587634-Pyramimonas_sp.AAC.1